MLFRKIQNEVQSGQVMQRPNLSAWLYVTPLMLVLFPFFLLPTLVVLVASFFATDGFGGLTPGFTLASYVEVLHSALTLKLYLATIKFTVLTWIFTLDVTTARVLHPPFGVSIMAVTKPKPDSPPLARATG